MDGGQPPADAAGAMSDGSEQPAEGSDDAAADLLSLREPPQARAHKLQVTRTCAVTGCAKPFDARNAVAQRYCSVDCQGEAVKAGAAPRAVDEYTDPEALDRRLRRLVSYACSVSTSCDT